MVDNLKNISIPNRQKIIMILGLDKRYEQLLIFKYCEGLSNDEIASKFYIEPESLDKIVTKARRQFNNILNNEYHLFNDDQKKYLDLIRG